MVQIKTGQSELFCGPNCRPPNSSHFRNLKRLKIDKWFLKEKERERNRERELEGRKEKRGEEEGKRQETAQEVLANKTPYLERRGKRIKMRHLCRLRCQ